MIKTKIKDMTPSQLKQYRKKQYLKRKKIEEKEQKQQEKAIEKRKKVAKKAAITRKKNMIAAKKEEEKAAEKRKKVAKKAAVTRKKNILAAKKEERQKKKEELEKKREEKRKNKIVVPKSKPVKNMTPEEYSEYKKEYARIYNERKRQQKQQIEDKNVSRRLSGKALNIWKNEMLDENDGRKFSQIKENAKYLMIPRLNNKISIFSFDGIRAYCEVTSTVSLSVNEKERRANVSLNFFIIPKNFSGGHIVAEDFWSKDVSDLIDELTDKNFFKKLQPITNEQIESMREWTTIDFLKHVIHNSKKNKMLTAEILWQCFDKSYARENDISMKTLEDIALLKKI